MKQAFYSLVDFLLDPDFRDWVKQPNEARNTYWQQFLEQYPDQRSVVEQARQYIRVLAEQTAQHQPLETESQLMRQTIQHRIREEKNITSFSPSAGNTWRWARLAASVALILGLGVLTYRYSQRQTSQPEGYRHFLQATPVGTALSEVRNPGTKPLTILLSDGSSVVLQPGSRLKYPNQFEQREVYLVGKAFFEVVKDPTRPFLVYTRGVATKVLGTSFSIDAPETNQPINVAVKTGKVAVYSLDKPAADTHITTDATLSGLVLTSNQSAEYLTDGHRLVRKSDTLSIFAQPGTLAVAKQSFDFDETPVAEVFRTLEKAYGVDIVYDESRLRNCSLSASLVGQPLHEKLSVVCKALEVQYTFLGNQVVITGGQHCQ